jgi:hypothetical protein
MELRWRRGNVPSGVRKLAHKLAWLFGSLMACHGPWLDLFHNRSRRLRSCFTPPLRFYGERPGAGKVNLAGHLFMEHIARG